jgi:8-oxo-dGTP diphosphatase
VLVVLRKNAPYQDHWSLPGGKLNEGEDIIRGARRELREETGVDLPVMKGPYKILVVSERFKVHVCGGLYTWSGTIEPGDDAKDARFINVHALKALRTTPGLPEIVREVACSLSEGEATCEDE